MASDHRLAKLPDLHVEDVSEERYTMTMSMSREWQKASKLEPWRSRPRNALRVRTVIDAMEAIQSGAAVSIGPSCLARYAPVTGVRYLPLDVSGRPFSLICRRESADRLESREFVTVAAETARRLTPLVTALH